MRFTFRDVCSESPDSHRGFKTPLFLARPEVSEF